MAPVEVFVGLPPKQFFSNPGGFHVLAKYWMEVVEGFEYGLLPVNISNGDGRVELIGVVLYCIRP